MSDDTELVQRARAGDSRARERLFSRHDAALRAAIRKVLRNPDDVNDAVQDAYEKAWGALRTFRGESSFQTWLCTIGRRVALDTVRAAKRRPAGRYSTDATGENGEPLLVLPDHVTPENLLEAYEAAERMVRAQRADERRRRKPQAERIEVPVSDPGGELLAAYVFLAVLAYPESTAHRGRAILAMHTLMLRLMRKAGRALPPNAGDVLRELPQRNMENTLRRFDDRMEKRMLAAEHAAMLELDIRNSAGTKLRLTDYADRYPAGRSFYMREVWKPEVGHLGLALRAVALEWKDPRGFWLLPLLANPQWVRRALASAEVTARYLPVTTNLAPALRGLRAGRFIRLIPV